MSRNYFSPLIPAFQLSIRAAFAAGLAVIIAQLLRFDAPIYAMIAAVIVSDLSPARTRQLGLQRLGGSVLGAVVGAVTSQSLPPGAWAIGFSVLIAMFLSHLVRLQGAAKLSGYLSGIVVLGHASDAWSYGFCRLLETVLGIGMALLVGFIPKLISLDEPRQDS
jgi:uncharacterized membrane protein YgaE (UPF0421/DUF939 family)